jgi:hypothetical protein
VKETITHTAVKSPQEFRKSLLLCGRKKAADSSKFFNGAVLQKLQITLAETTEKRVFSRVKQGDGKF